MKVVFLGVGETGDENLHNTSVLVENGSTIMLDCGFLSVKQLWRYNPDANFLDAIYISHFHADHYFGLGGLFCRMMVENRKAPLTIICQRGGKSKIIKLWKMAYNMTISSLGFKINFVEVKPGSETKINGYNLTYGRTVHQGSNLAVRVEADNHSICYSGDGEFIKQTQNLYRGTDLLIHESFYMNRKKTYTGHSSLSDLIPMAIENEVKKLACVHIDRKIRNNKLDEFKEKAAKLSKESPLKVIVPKEMHVIEFKD